MHRAAQGPVAYLIVSMTTRVTVSSLIESALLGTPRVNEDTSTGDAQTLAQGEVSVDDIVEKLNSIRSGKSFDDDAVSTAMDTWVKGLDDAEKTALFAFLKGIAQIVTGEVPAQQATEPSDAPAGVDMKKEPTSLKVSVRPNVIRRPGVDGTSKQPPKTRGGEDTSGPVPIKAKKKG